MKPHRPKKWPKNAIKMKILGVDETPQMARPSPKNISGGNQNWDRKVKIWPTYSRLVEFQPGAS